MENIAKVLIAIQARSTSTRLPGKCYEPIGRKRLLDHVIDACNRAASHMNKFVDKSGYLTETALLIPEGDPIKEAFGKKIAILEGPEHDVLTRYAMAHARFEPDYICRITGDCPLIPPFVISKHISLGINVPYDYISNVDERCRLSLDGIDCEVISSELMTWLDINSGTDLEREHVTIKARRDPPKWAKLGFTASFFDQSGIKLSVDTQEELEAARYAYDVVGSKLVAAERIYGRQNVHRF